MTTDLRSALAHVLETPSAGAPNECYTEEDVFALERDSIFRNHWACLGFAKDAPRPGDAYPVNFLGQPLVMVRDKQNALRVFHNICSHRGVVLVEQACNTKGVIRCPYHSWCYDLGGALRKTPFVGGPGVDKHPDFDPGAHGLQEVRSHIWMGMVFVALSGAAPAFNLAHARLLSQWSDFADAPLYNSGPDSTIELTLEANWKLAVENYVEAYHLPWVHPGLNSYSRLEDHDNIVEDQCYSGQVTRVYRPMLSQDGAAFAPLPDISDYWDTRGEYVALYPNVLLGVHKDHFYGILIEPISAHETRERVEIFYFDEASVGPDLAALREANTRAWRLVFTEDVGVVSAMQRGRTSPAFGGGVLTPVLDAPTRCFHEWVARAMLDSGAPGLSRIASA